MTYSQEIYISTDIEADGPIPGPHSRLSFASAAYLADRQLISTFSANLEILPGTVGHPETMSWWEKHPEAWAKCRENTRPAEIVMPEYVKWIDTLPGKPVFVAYPASYDFLFVYWYLIKYVGESPFSHSALDIKTFARAMLRKGYRECTKKTCQKDWFEELNHSHVALDDAIEQGAFFCTMLAENISINNRDK